MRISSCLVALVAAALAAPAARAQLTLTSSGGGTVAGVTSVTVSGPPGTQYFLLMSLNGGPTPLPPPHQPSTLDVGFDLLTISASLPGFIGFIPGGGSASVLLPIPFLPVLTSLQLHFQAVKINFGAVIAGKSNPWILTPAYPGFTRTALSPMSLQRSGHTATPLPSGKVLFIGGGADGLVASYGQTAIDLYDPGTQTFTHVGDLLQARTSHTATLLNDGRILVTGGAEDVLGEPTRTAEIVDTTTFVSSPLPNLATERALHTATLLADGRVLVAGGTSSFQNPFAIVTSGKSSTDLFNPVTNTFAAGPSMAEPRIGHTATRLNDGRVLVAGGFANIASLIPYITNKAQVYLPNLGIGSFGSSITMTSDRFGHAAVLKADGNVLIAGGAADQLSDPINPLAVASIEEFVVGSLSFQPHGALSKARGALTGTRLPNGNMVFAGGAFGSLATPTADDTLDLYDVGIAGVTSAMPMQHVRGYHTATTLVDGTILLAGGGEFFVGSTPFAYDDAEIYHP